MASPGVSSDEGEIVERTSKPHVDGDSGNQQSRYRDSGRNSRSPKPEAESKYGRRGPDRRRSRSPARGQKRGRDDRDSYGRRPGSRGGDGGDPRQFRVHYEDRNGPPSRYPNPNGRYDDRHQDHRDSGRNRDGYPDKRRRNRSRSPANGAGRGRVDGGGRSGFYRASDQAESSKYSAHLERQSPEASSYKRASVTFTKSSTSGHGTKAGEGVSLNRTREDAASQKSAPNQPPGQDQVDDRDFDELSLVDKEAQEAAEIARRKQAREAARLSALRRLGGSTPDSRLEIVGNSTPGSTQLNSPMRTEGNTPRSDSPALSTGQDVMSPSALDIANDGDLINLHGGSKILDEDGPSAADYDPTADMKEDERRDELRHGGVGLHGEDRRPSQGALAAEAPELEAAEPAKDDDDDGFDMFAEDFDEDKFVAPKASAKAAASQAEDGATQGAPADGGAILDGDDKDGYYKIRPGEVLNGRYHLQSTLGKGMFSGVARAVDITNKKLVAIKIMRNNDALRKGGFTEIAILQKLNAADPENKKHIVKFERSFEYKGHLCMAFENLSLNLREVLKKFGNNIGINLGATRAYAYQIFLALGHLRKCSIIHADLKPDNILVNENRNILKICDLGTAIDRSDAATAHNEVTPYLVSRFYRAPEIILGAPYDYAADMWSIGCTLYELYTGKILFAGDSNNQMLKAIMEIRGKLSSKLYRRGQLWQMHFDEVGNFVSIERDKALGKTAVRTLTMVKPTRDLRTRLMAASSSMNDAETRELNHFVDLLERCLALNPDRRITPSEALKHPFFTQKAHSSVR